MKSSNKGSYSFKSDPIKGKSLTESGPDANNQPSRSFKLGTLLRRESSKRHEAPKTNTLRKLSATNNNNQSDNYNYRSSAVRNTNESAPVKQPDSFSAKSDSFVYKSDSLVTTSAKTIVPEIKINSSSTVPVSPASAGSNSTLDTPVVSSESDKPIASVVVGASTTLKSVPQNTTGNLQTNVNDSLDISKSRNSTAETNFCRSKIDSVNSRNSTVDTSNAKGSTVGPMKQTDSRMNSLRSTRVSTISVKSSGSGQSEYRDTSIPVQKSTACDSKVDTALDSDIGKSSTLSVSSKANVTNNKIAAVEFVTQDHPVVDRGPYSNGNTNGGVHSVSTDFTSQSLNSLGSNGTYSNDILVSAGRPSNGTNSNEISAETISLSSPVSNNCNSATSFPLSSGSVQYSVTEARDSEESKLELDTVSALSRDFTSRDKSISTSQFRLSLPDPFSPTSSVSSSSPGSPRAPLLVRPASSQLLSELSPADSDDSYSTLRALDHSGARGQIDRSHPFFSRVRHEDPDTTIYSTKGTVRGIQNRVKAGLSLFQDEPKNKEWSLLERDRIVVYTTSVQVVRKTFIRCLRIRKILQTHRVLFEDRDVFISKDFNRELSERLSAPEPELPQLFADGVYIGDATEVERLNENGTLREIFKEFKKVDSRLTCGKCGGYRYIPCTTCNGSRKTRRNAFTAEFSSLRCTACDRNGLIKCDLCDVSNNNTDNKNPNSNSESNDGIISDRGNIASISSGDYSKTTSLSSELGSPLGSSSGIGSVISSGVGSGISSSNSSISSSGINGINTQDMVAGDSYEINGDIEAFNSVVSRENNSRGHVDGRSRSSAIISNDNINGSYNGHISSTERKAGGMMDGRNNEQKSVSERFKVKEEEATEMNIVDTKL